jgi:hypothetical protein
MMRGLDLCRRAAGQFLLPRRGKCIAFSRGKRLCPAASNQRPAFSAAYSTSELRQGFDSAGSGSDVYVSGDWTTEHARASLVGRVVVGTVMFVARCVRAEALWLWQPLVRELSFARGRGCWVIAAAQAVRAGVDVMT